ncbi:MAG: DegV family protein [Clostridia bacterium]|nr:DegV family protein [Clostridia bacterium]
MIKLIVDCTCEMGVAEAEKLGIISMPMRMIIDDKEYLAGENLDNDTFYNLLPKAQNMPKTMQINVNDYLEAIKPILEAGDEVFVMSVSSGLSGTFNSLTQAVKELNSEHVAVFDSQTFTLAYYALVMEARKLIEQGVALTELTQKMEELRERVRIYFIADTMKYLVKGGRISFVKGLLAETLHVKPIIGVVDKKLQMVGKGIGYNAAKRQILRLAKDVDLTMPIYYGHIHDSEKAEDFKQIFSFGFTEKREIGPIVGAHGGPGCVGLAFFQQKSESNSQVSDDTVDNAKKTSIVQNLYNKIVHKKD